MGHIHRYTQTDPRISNTLRRVIIATKKAPDAIGPYNQAVQVNTTLYISGQIGFVPETMEVIKGGVVSEAKQALTNMGHILDAANCTFDNVVKTTVLLADINDFGAVNEVYTTFFSDNYPARAAYQFSVRWPPYHGEPGWR